MMPLPERVFAGRPLTRWLWKKLFAHFAVDRYWIAASTSIGATVAACRYDAQPNDAPAKLPTRSAGTGGAAADREQASELGVDQCEQDHDHRRDHPPIQLTAASTQSVRMAQRNDGEVAVVAANSHRADDVFAVGLEVVGRAENGFEITGLCPK